MNITQEQIDRLNKILDAGLVSGLGNRAPGEFCVEAAVCYALDLPHGDDPGCVSPALRACKIRLNDSPWSSNKARAEGLRKLAIAQLGSKGVLDDKKFAERLAIVTVQRLLPRVLRRAGLEAAASQCEAATDLKSAAVSAESAEAAASAAEAAASAAESAEAAAWAASAAWAAAKSAASAARAAWAAESAEAASAAKSAASAAKSAASAASAAAKSAADAADAADAALLFFADLVLEVLREQPGLPGLKFL